MQSKVFERSVKSAVVVVAVAVVVVAVVAVVLAFAVDAAVEFDVVISADVAAVVFHLVVLLVLFVVTAGAFDFENGDGDFAVACYFLDIFADYFRDLDDVVESAVYRLHLTVLFDLAIFL